MTASFHRPSTALQPALCSSLELLKTGDLGDIRYIRALWHRNNATPSWTPTAIRKMTRRPVCWSTATAGDRPFPQKIGLLSKVIKQHGYKSMEELCRWRLFDRTGGGLMAELGSHQLDACSIFLGKVHPLAVSGVGGKYFYKDDRDCDDHVYVTFEFPGKNYPSDPKRHRRRDLFLDQHERLRELGRMRDGRAAP